MDSPEIWFHRKATAYVETQILFHLNQVGVWRLLSRGEPLTAAQIAEELGLELQPTDALLDYIHGVDDLLEREGDAYTLSEFGKRVIERFSDLKGGEGRAINMFDVRVGAYGPVWQNAGRMLRGDGRYGQDFHRAGHYAEDGVFKLAMRFWDSLVEHVEEFDPPQVLEVGLSTGLTQRLAQTYPARTAYGLDRNGQAIERNAARAQTEGVDNIKWIQADFFDVERWAEAVDPERPGLLYSLHFHELIAEGEDRLLDAMKRLKAALPNWVVLAFEQPRLPQSDRGSISETLWLYSQSNILIHHLIGNGKILTHEAWLGLGDQAGCKQVTDRPCNFLGYRAFAYQL